MRWSSAAYSSRATWYGPGVGVAGDHRQLVLGGERGGRDAALAGVVRSGVELRTVEGDLAHGRAVQVDEAGRARLGAAEPDGGVRDERLRPRRQVEIDV